MTGGAVVTDEPGEAEGAAEPSTSRAGRDLPAAIAVGLVLGAGILASLLFAREAFVGLVAAAMAVGTYELATAMRRASPVRIQLLPVLFGGQAVIWLAWPYGLDGMMAAFAATVLLCLLWRLPLGADGYVRDVGASVLVLAYVPLCGAFAALLVLPDDGVGRVLTVLIVAIASDTGGYAAGALRGRHPMAPSISPKKSWEGFAGSQLAGIAAGVICLPVLLDGEVWHGVAFGIAIVLTATLGDLVESVIKRDIGIKDMGTLLPGHGGLMDRLDSLLPSVVVAWLLLSAFV